MEQTHEFLSRLSGSDLKSWVIVNTVYQRYCQDVGVYECGINNQTGNVFIALENGITLASAFGGLVEFVVYDSNEYGYEHSYVCYEDALNHKYAR